MNIYPRTILLWTLILLALAACSSSMPPSPSISDMEHIQNQKSAKYPPPRQPDQIGNNYYYFTEAQLLQKKGNFAGAVEYLLLAIDQDPQSTYLKRELAILFLQLKNNEQALKVVENIIKSAPDDVEALIMLGSIKQTLKNTDEAKAAYRQVLKYDPNREQIYLLLGRLYMEDKQYDEASQTFKSLTKQFPESYIGFFYLGKINADQGKLVAAEKDFKKTLELEPELLEPRFELVDIYKQQKDNYEVITVIPGDSLNYLCFKHYNEYNETIKNVIVKYNPELDESDVLQVGQKLRFPSLATIKQLGANETKDEKIIRLYSEVLDLYPDNVKAAVELGLYLYHQNNPSQAFSIFQELGERSTTEQNIIRYIIQYLFDKKQYEDSIIVVKGMIKGAPENSDLHYIIGLAYDGLQMDKKVIEHLKQVKPESRFYSSAMVQTALMLQDRSKHEEAIRLLETAASNKPEDVEILLYLGSIYEDLENFNKAHLIYLQGIELDQDNKRLHYRLGVTYDKWDNKEASIEEMKTVIQLDPKDANALNYLGYTYADLGIKLDEAEQLIKEALKYKPDDGYITDSLGWVYFKKGKLDEAIELLEKAVTLVSDDPILLEHLGDAFAKKCNKKKALYYYKRALLVKKKNKSELEKKIKEIDAIAENHLNNHTP